MNLSRKRRFLIWLNVSVMVLLMAAFLVGINLIAHARFARIDMTTDKVWEISDQSRQILKSVPRDLEIYINAVSPGPAAAQDKALPEAWRRAQLLLFEMANQNQKIKVAPILEASQAQARVFSQVGQPEPNMIYFIYRTADDKPLSRAMSITDLYVSNPQSGEVAEFFGEARIITAIANLISDRKIRIYCVEGHKEVPLGASEGRSLSVVGARLTALENAEFKPLNLGRDKVVPDDADLVFIAAPTSDYSTIETDALRKYWARGGRLFVATYPLTQDPMDEFRKFLETCGVRVNRDVVVDAVRERGDSGVILVQRYTKHPVNQNQLGLAFDFPYSSSVDAQVVSRAMQSMPLFLSSEKCWTETDLNSLKTGPRQSAGERWGPIPLAVAAEEAVTPQKTARIVAWGGVSALTNELNLIQDKPNDLTLSYIVNNLRWLVDREMLVQSKPNRQPRMRPFAPPAGADTVIGWLSLAVIPFIGVALGGLAWYFRRK